MEKKQKKNRNKMKIGNNIISTECNFELTARQHKTCFYFIFFSFLLESCRRKLKKKKPTTIELKRNHNRTNKRKK